MPPRRRGPHPGGVLVILVGRWQCGSAGPGAAVGALPGARSAQRRGAGRDHSVGHVPRGPGLLRRRVLRGVPPRSGADGSPAAPRVGSVVGGAGTRRHRPAVAGRQRHRGADGRELRRLRQVADGGSRRDRGLDGNRHVTVWGGQPGFAPARPSRAECGPRRCVCSVPGRRAPGVSTAARRGDVARAGRWRQRVDRTGADPRARCRGCHCAGRSLQDLRRFRRRIRARRGCGRGGAQASRRGAARR